MPEPVLQCLPRSAVNLIRVIAGLDLEHKFLPEDLDGDGHNETKCNFAADAFAQAMGVYLIEGRANDKVEWLSSAPAKVLGWEEISAPTAESLEALVAVHIAHGRPVFACYWNPKPRFHPKTGARLVDGKGKPLNRPGHIAFGTPTPAREVGIRIAQAGANNFSCGRVSDGFGNLPVRWFVHD